jgi:Xaa-Pro aminopeptidase
VSSEARISALRERLVADSVAALLVGEAANMRYLTGFEGVFDGMAAGAVVVTATDARYYTDSRYVEAARSAAAGTQWDVRLQVESLYGEAVADLRGDGFETLAMESSVPYARFKMVSELFGGRVLVIDHAVEDLRAVKDAGELAAVERAAALTDEAFDHVLGILRPGLREVDVALALEAYMRGHGSEGVAFEPIVASGPNSSKPHAGITMRVIGEGELLTMDFGARVDGYCADMTRTVVVGRASDEQRRVYDAVLAANEAGRAAVRAGAHGDAVDGVARALLTERGYGEAFGHGLGHGVGLEVHEMPGLRKRSTDVLVSGHVVTVEPGVYLPGFGGVRIEDLVAVEEGGHKLLSHSRRDLIEIV